MRMLTEAQAKAILDKVLALSKADQCTAQLTGSIDGNVRFALNNVSTAGIVSNTDLAGRGRLRQARRHRDDQCLRRRRARTRASAAPRTSPGSPPKIPNSSPRSRSRRTSRARPSARRRRRSRPTIARRSPPIRSSRARPKKLVAAGFLQDGQSFVAFANSQGQLRLSARHQPRLSPAPSAPTTAAARAGSGATSQDVDRVQHRAATSAPRCARRARRPTPRRWSRASTP